MSIYENEDHIEEMRQERMWQRRRRRNTNCSDGYCGADDCHTCRPGNREGEGDDEHDSE